MDTSNMVPMTFTRIAPGTIVSRRRAPGLAEYVVLRDFGAIGYQGETFCEVEPYPNDFADEPFMVATSELVGRPVPSAA